MCNVQIHFHYPPDNNKCGHFKLKPKISNINSTHPAMSCELVILLLNTSRFSFRWYDCGNKTNYLTVGA